MKTFKIMEYPEKPPNIATVLRELNPGESYSWPFDEAEQVRNIVSYLHKKKDGKWVTERQGNVVIVTKKKNA
jgi:hypothetical protein